MRFLEGIEKSGEEDYVSVKKILLSSNLVKAGRHLEDTLELRKFMLILKNKFLKIQKTVCQKVKSEITLNLFYLLKKLSIKDKQDFFNYFISFTNQEINWRKRYRMCL